MSTHILDQHEWHGQINGRDAIAIPSHVGTLEKWPDQTHLRISIFLKAGGIPLDSAVGLDCYEHQGEDRPRAETEAEWSRILRALGFRPHAEQL